MSAVATPVSAPGQGAEDRVDVSTLTVAVVMRSMNDIDVIGDTLAGVKSQRSREYQLVNIDSGSTDGTIEVIEQYTDNLIRIQPEDYIPGRVLNMGMEETDADIVVFLNSDCTPTSEEWLEKLIEPFVDPTVAATFGRQDPRPDCWPLYAKDTVAAFGDGKVHEGWRHFFSMANSAVRRTVWEQHRFDPDIRYSEDVEWTWRLRGLGYRIAYAAESPVMHSHNYTLRQVYRRQHGEGDADARIFGDDGWRAGWLAMVPLGAAKDILRDVRWCLTNGRPLSILHSVLLRPVMRQGRWAGYWSAMRELRGLRS